MQNSDTTTAKTLHYLMRCPQLNNHEASKSCKVKCLQAKPQQDKTCSHMPFVRYPNHIMHASSVTLKQTTAERLQPHKNVSGGSKVKHTKLLTQLWCHTPEYNESDSHSSRSRADFLLLERVLRDRMSSPPFAKRKRSFSPKRLMRNSVLPIPMPSRV